MCYPLPDDTVEALGSHRRTCFNVGLLLDKFAECDEADWTLTLETKRREDMPKGFMKPEMAQLLRSCRLRNDAVRKCYRAKGYTVIDFSGQPDYRLVVGFGAEHVLETSLCLHRIYGFPIIPGSAVKGVTRAWAFWEIAEALGMPDVSAEERERREKAKRKTPLQLLDELLSEGQKTREEVLERLQQDELCRDLEKMKSLTLERWHALVCDLYTIFGTTDEQGWVVFFDAYPTDSGRLKFELDILNPHYGPYYSDSAKRTPPADYHSPVPTYFLTVKGSPFQFAIASKNPDLASKAREWLTHALTNLGIGGKTAAGYGFMRVR